MIIAIALDNEETVESIKNELSISDYSKVTLGPEDEADYFFMGGKLMLVDHVRSTFEDWKAYSIDPQAIVVVDN